MKSNKGITLVALVVTIIVLIILAGVSISMVLGQDGIVQKAKQGRDNYAEAARIENEQLANVDAFSQSIGIYTGKHVHTGNPETGGGCYKPIYHVHEGNETDGGGCYQTPVYHVHKDECKGECVISVASVVSEDPSIQFCSRGEHWGYSNIGTVTATLTHSSCGQPDSTQKLFNVCYECFRDRLAYAKEQIPDRTHNEQNVCGKTEEDIEKYALSCGKDTNYIERYELGCGQ